MRWTLAAPRKAMQIMFDAAINQPVPGWIALNEINTISEPVIAMQYGRIRLGAERMKLGFAASDERTDCEAAVGCPSGAFSRNSFCQWQVNRECIEVR